MSKQELSTAVAANAQVATWMATLRQAMFDAIKEEDVKQVVQSIVDKAKKGDAQAQRMLFDYVLGAKGAAGHQTHADHRIAARLPRVPGRQSVASGRVLSVIAARAERGEDLFDPEDEMSPMPPSTALPDPAPPRRKRGAGFRTTSHDASCLAPKGDTQAVD